MSQEAFTQPGPELTPHLPRVQKRGDPTAQPIGMFARQSPTRLPPANTVEKFPVAKTAYTQDLDLDPTWPEPISHTTALASDIEVMERSRFEST